MIVLGCYGVLGAIKTYQEKRNKRDHDIERYYMMLDDVHLLIMISI